MRTLISLQFRYRFTAEPTTCDATLDIRRGIRARLQTLDSHPDPMTDEGHAWVDRERLQCIADLKRWGVTTEWERVHG